MAGLLEVVLGDITTLHVDAIVNAANNSLLGGGGVDGAIHRAAGPRLQAHCRRLGGCPTGEARWTPGFDLPANAILHTVGPVWYGGHKDEPALLEQAYRSVLALANEKGIRSLAIPMISCGVFGYPANAAAEIAVRTCRAALAGAGSVRHIALVAFSEAGRDVLQQAVNREDE